MRVGVRLPQYGGDWGTLVATATVLGRRGVDHLWVNDHLRSPGRRKAEPVFEAFTTLAALAALVPDVGLGVAVASAAYRPAVLTAKMASVVDVISGGRLVLGLGTGSDRGEHAAYGYPWGTRAARTAGLREHLRVVRAMRDSPDGADIGAGAGGAPNRPAPTGGLPVWVAAHGPVLLRLAGERADGIVAAWVTPDALTARVGIAAEAADRAGRPCPRVAVYTFCLPVASRADAEAWVAEEAAALGTTPRAVLRWLGTTGIVGAPDEVRDRLGALAAAGATDVILALPSRVPLEAFEAVAETALGAPAPTAPPPVPVPAGAGVSARHNLVHLLVGRHREAGHGGRPALVDDGVTWTYDALADAAARAAGALAARGVRRGDRVAVALRDGHGWVAAFLGAASLGAVPVPVDPLAPAAHLAAVLDDCGPAVVVAEPDTAAVAHPRIGADALAGGPPLPVRAVHPDDLAYIVYSSGSTGRPKGVMHAHRDMETAVEGYARGVLGLGPGDRCHSAARLFTSLGFGNGFFRPLGRGATAVMSPRRPNPRVTLDVVDRHGVTVLTGVPTFWSQLAGFLDHHPRPGALAGVRLAVSSGDRLPAAVAARLEAATGLRLVEGLGCAECSNVVLSTRPGDRPDGTLGTVVPGVEVDLRDPDGRPVPDGEPGRLWIRSPSNTGGYWRRSALTRDLVHGEWIRMGDVLVREAGVYRHVGRADDLFKVDARWVSPGEVEACIAELPGVAEVAVGGVPGAEGLVRVHAWVVTDPGAAVDPAGVRRHVAHRLAPHMAPAEVTLRDALPRLPSGKLDRRALREGRAG